MFETTNQLVYMFAIIIDYPFYQIQRKNEKCNDCSAFLFVQLPIKIVPILKPRPRANWLATCLATPCALHRSLGEF